MGLDSHLNRFTCWVFGANLWIGELCTRILSFLLKAILQSSTLNMNIAYCKVERKSAPTLFSCLFPTNGLFQYSSYKYNDFQHMRKEKTNWPFLSFLIALHLILDSLKQRDPFLCCVPLIIAKHVHAQKPDPHYQAKHEGNEIHFWLFCLVIEWVWESLGNVTKKQHILHVLPVATKPSI